MTSNSEGGILDPSGRPIPEKKDHQVANVPSYEEIINSRIAAGLADLRSQNESDLRRLASEKAGPWIKLSSSPWM
ncbi:MAG: hypothetical protein ACREIA_25230, partial [Opitutaceae bacterium]